MGEGAAAFLLRFGVAMVVEGRGGKEELELARFSFTARSSQSLISIWTRVRANSSDLQVDTTSNDMNFGASVRSKHSRSGSLASCSSSPSVPTSFTILSWTQTTTGLTDTHPVYSLCWSTYICSVPGLHFLNQQLLDAHHPSPPLGRCSTRVALSRALTISVHSY